MARVRVKVPAVPVEHHTDPEPVAAAPVSDDHQTPSQKRHIPNRYIWLGVGAIVLLFIVIGLINDRNQLQQQVADLSKTSTGGQSIQDITKHLNTAIELPRDETPQSRVINDVSQFASQNPALAEIKDGDMLLLYEKSKKVVVYRPSTKKAVVVVTLAAAPTSSSKDTTPTANR